MAAESYRQKPSANLASSVIIIGYRWTKEPATEAFAANWGQPWGRTPALGAAASAPLGRRSSYSISQSPDSSRAFDNGYKACPCMNCSGRSGLARDSGPAGPDALILLYL